MLTQLLENLSFFYYECCCRQSASRVCVDMLLYILYSILYTIFLCAYIFATLINENFYCIKEQGHLCDLTRADSVIQ